MANDVEMANDEGADPTSDIHKQNREGTRVADTVKADDPHKVEKLAAADGAIDDPNAGSD